MPYQAYELGKSSTPITVLPSPASLYQIESINERILDSVPKKASPVSKPAATMNVLSKMSARCFSAAVVPSLSFRASIRGANFLSSQLSRATPPISIGNVCGTSRYIPSPKEVPIPVAHSTNIPKRKPSARRIKSPSPSAKITENVANALACGAMSWILPSASWIERKIATPAPIIAPGTTPMIFPFEI